MLNAMDNWDVTWVFIDLICPVSREHGDMSEKQRKRFQQTIHRCQGIDGTENRLPCYVAMWV